MKRWQEASPGRPDKGDVHGRQAITEAKELDSALLPALPGDWCFCLAHAALDPTHNLEEGLKTLGFRVIRELSALPAKGGIVLILASLIDDGCRHGLPSDVAPSAMVAFSGADEFEARLAARRHGADVLLDFPPKLPGLLRELAGVAWMPRSPYRVLLMSPDQATRELLALELRQIGLDVLALSDPRQAFDQAPDFYPEVSVITGLAVDAGATTLALLRGIEGLGRVPGVLLLAKGEVDNSATIDAECLLQDVDVGVVRSRVTALARRSRAVETASRQQRLLRRQVDDLRCAIDAHAIVSVGALDGSIIDVNQKFCDVSGYTRKELIGRNHRIVKSGRHPPAFFEAMWQTIAAGKVWHGEVQNRRRDGSLYWVQGTIAPICDETGRPMRYISVRTEITAQKHALAERERQGRLLDAIRQSMARFIVDRNLAATSSVLLDAILSITDSVFGFIGEVQYDADGQPFLRAHAISNIAWSPDAGRALAAIRNGGLEMRNLDSLYGIALTTGLPVISNDPASDPRHSPLPPGHPPLDSFLGMPIRHGETLVGMVGLANRVGGYDEELIDFLAPLAATYGGILEAARMRAMQQRMIDELHGEREAGAVMQQATRELLLAWRRDFRNRLNAIVGHAQILLLNERFEPDASAQVQEIVHGGELLTNEFDALVERLDLTEGPFPAASVTGASPLSSKTNRNILVAEDNPANQAVLRMQLELLGYAVEIAGDGAAALEKWQAGTYDLILADRNMPGMDGLALTRAIRASERASGGHVPIIAITAANHAGELSLCLEAGMDDALAKPIELDDLRQLLDRWMRSLAGSSGEARDSAPPESGAVLDTGYLARILGNVGIQQLRELVDLFTTTAHADLPGCRQLLAAGNGRAIGLAMHRLKSSARMVGALRFAALAEALEISASEGRLEMAVASLDELSHAVTDVEAAVQRVVVAPTPTLSRQEAVNSVPAMLLPRKVLVVDDDPVARHQLSMLLAALGVDDVCNVAGGVPGLVELGKPGVGFDLLITDLNMPGMDGIEFLRRLVDVDYRGHVILCSGVKDRLLHTAADLTRAKGLRLLGTLKKPAKREALLELLTNPRNDTLGRDVPTEAVAVSPNDISEGIRRDEFSIQFQPKVDARTLRVVGVEALARWTRDGRAIAPDAFIRAAERHGLIAPLSEVLVTKALIGGARMAEAGFPLQVAINLSASWLAEMRLPEFIMATIQATGFNQESLVIEVTETGVMADVATSMDVMTRLRLKGFKLSIDDFGIGYSSMEQLQRFPFGELKLDRSFVQRADNPTTRAILASTLDMARKLKLTTVAEGVETLAELDLVRGLGCELVQGWLVAPSMAVEDLIDWMRARETGGR